MLYKLANLLNSANTVIGFKCFDLDTLSVVALTVDEYNSIEEYNKFNSQHDSYMLVYKDSRWELSGKTLDTQYILIGYFDFLIDVCLYVFIELSTEQTLLAVNIFDTLYFDILNCETFRAFNINTPYSFSLFAYKNINYHKLSYFFEHSVDEVSIYRETGCIITLGDYFYHYTIENDIIDTIAMPSECRYLILNFTFFNTHSLKVVLPKNLRYIKFYNYCVVAEYLDVDITFYISKHSTFIENIRSEIDGVFSSRVNIELY